MTPERLLSRLLKGTVANVDFADAQRLAEALGFKLLRVTGSHHVYSRPNVQEPLNLQNRRGQAKPYQLRQLTMLVRKYNLGLKEGQ